MKTIYTFLVMVMMTAFGASSAYAGQFIDCSDEGNGADYPIVCGDPMLRLRNAEMERLSIKVIGDATTKQIADSNGVMADFRNYEAKRDACKTAACVSDVITAFREKILYQRKFVNGDSLGDKYNVLRVVSTAAPVNITGFVVIEDAGDGDVGFYLADLNGQFKMPIVGYFADEQMMHCLFLIGQNNNPAFLQGTIISMANGLVLFDMTGSKTCKYFDDAWAEKNAKVYNPQ